MLLVVIKVTVNNFIICITLQIFLGGGGNCIKVYSRGKIAQIHLHFNRLEYTWKKLFQILRKKSFEKKLKIFLLIILISIFAIFGSILFHQILFYVMVSVP